jgi:hypothetical protein
MLQAVKQIEPFDRSGSDDVRDEFNLVVCHTGNVAHHQSPRSRRTCGADCRISLENLTLSRQQNGDIEQRPIAGCGVVPSSPHRLEDGLAIEALR